MDVLLIGTGAAGGWPNAFCRCASCAGQRARGLFRAPTSVLLDGRVLLDCGPTAEANVQRFGVDLADLDAVLVTHAHPDHLDPTFLQHRGWVTDRPLAVVGPAPVVERCREWASPAVNLHTVTAGDVVEVAGFTVDVLPATHEAFGEAVLYRLRRDAVALLYATDTGPWTPRALELVAGVPLDLVLLEETHGDQPDRGPTHHHLGTFAEALADLRRVGAIGDATRVVAVHLGHNNPPEDALAARLADLGAEAHPDGTTLRV